MQVLNKKLNLQLLNPIESPNTRQQPYLFSLIYNLQIPTEKNEKRTCVNMMFREPSSEAQLGPVVASNKVFFSTAPHPSPSIPTWAGATGIIISHQQNQECNYLIREWICFICSDRWDMIRLLSQHNNLS